MAIIPLPKGLSTIIDDADFDSVSQHKWSLAGKRYARARIGKSFVYLHRFIMRPESNMEVDHIDGDSLNNKRSNLRICTHQQNTFNQKPQRMRSSQYRGVHYLPQKRLWVASLTLDGRQVLQRWCKSEIDAARIYDAAAREYFGEFAYCNFTEHDNAE